MITLQDLDALEQKVKAQQAIVSAMQGGLVNPFTPEKHAAWFAERHELRRLSTEFRKAYRQYIRQTPGADADPFGPEDLGIDHIDPRTAEYLDYCRTCDDLRHGG